MGIISVASGSSCWRGLEYYKHNKVEKIEKIEEINENEYKKHCKRKLEFRKMGLVEVCQVQQFMFRHHILKLQSVCRMLEKSCLYVSDYIERNKETYYDLLTRVRTQNDMISWIKFFLETVIETAKEKFRKVLELTVEMDKVVMELPVKLENAKKVIELMYDEPIITRNKIAEKTGIKLTTINGVVNALLEAKIITETTGYSRNQIFAFEKYINLFLK